MLFLPLLRFVDEVQAGAVVAGSCEQLARQEENIEELRVAKRAGDLSVSGEGQVDIHFRDLIHFAGELRQNLDADHAVLDASLEKLLHVQIDFAEYHLILERIEPAVLCDLC